MRGRRGRLSHRWFRGGEPVGRQRGQQREPTKEHVE